MHHRTAALLLLGLFVCVPTVRAASNSDLVASARKNLASGHYEEAERLFEQVVNNDPHDMEAWEGYKIAYEKRRAQEEGSEPGMRTPPRTAPVSASVEEPSESEEPPPPPVKHRPIKRQAPREEAREGESSEGGEDTAPPVREELGTVDAALLKNAKRAKERFEEARDERTGSYKRQKNGAVSIIVTFYDRAAYKLLAAYMASKKGWEQHQAQKLYETFARDQHGQLEFYVKLSNYSEKPKISVPIGDIVDHTVLVDEHGNAYKPVRWKGPKVRELVNDDSYTVYFSRSDSEGEDILKKAGKTCWLMISDMAEEAKSIQIEFSTALLRGDSTKSTKTKPKTLTDRMKNLFK